MTRTTYLHMTLLALAVVAIAACAPTEPIASSDEPQGEATTRETVLTPTGDPCLEHAYDEQACLEQMQTQPRVDDAGQRVCEGYETPRDMLEAMDAGECDVPPGFAADDAAPEAEPPVDVDGTYAADHEYAIKGASWKHSGVRLRISRLALVDRAAFCSGFDEFDEPTVCYDHYDGETIVALDMRVVNDSGRDVEFYADQAELVLGSEQVDTDSLLGPDDIGGTFRAGTQREGQAWWLSKQATDDVNALGEMRVIVGGPHWSDDFEPVTGGYDDIDLTVTW